MVFSIRDVVGIILDELQNTTGNISMTIIGGISL
jgi:hypothetical protein